MTFFAVQVKTGHEIKAKEMILHVFKKTNCHEASLLRAVYALESYTEYVSHREINPDIDFPNLDKKDISASLYLDGLKESLSNLKKQYEKLKSYKDFESKKMKKELYEKITKLVNHINTIRKDSKKIKAALPGYILLELKADLLYLPNTLWQLIKYCPAVIAIPSKYSIPKEEMNQFFEITIEPEIEIEFEVVKDYKEIIKKKKELVHAANKTDDKEKEKSFLKEFDNLEQDIVSEVNKLKESTVIEKIRAFIKNKKETISLPVSLFKKIYPRSDKMPSPPLSSTFVDRLKLLIFSKKVALE
ncbi:MULTISPECIES: hypothetical protein [Oceanobacillus]|nr:hypothetical protein [Oceanobacillus jeddahense]